MKRLGLISFDFSSFSSHSARRIRAIEDLLKLLVISTNIYIKLDKYYNKITAVLSTSEHAVVSGVVKSDIYICALKWATNTSYTAI